MKYTIGFLLLFVVQNSLADKPSADSILQQVRDQYDGESYATKVLLRLKSGDNHIRERQFYMLQKDISADEERALMYFHAPADVRDVSFLITNYRESLQKPDDQWIYFPAFRKVRRIGSNDKRGAFMGSTFNYSDLDKIRVNDYQNTLIGEEEINGRNTWIIERTAVDQSVINKTSYHKVHIWVDQKRFLAHQQHFYNGKGTVFKIQKTLEMEKIQDIWTITNTTMKDLEKGKSSEMIFSDTLYNIEVDSKQLSKRGMLKGIKASELSKGKS